MRASNIAFGLVLILFATTVIAVDNTCVKQTKQKYVQTDFAQGYSYAAVPDSRFEFPNYNHGKYYVVLKGYELKYDDFFGKKVLYLNLVYCDRDTKEVALTLQMYPGSAENPGIGFAGITYYGPVEAPLNVRCLNVGQKKSYSAVSNLYFSSAKNFETLLFRKVAARHVQQVTQNINRGNQPSLVNKISNNPPRTLGDPVNPFALNSCGASVSFYAG